MEIRTDGFGISTGRPVFSGVTGPGGGAAVAAAAAETRMAGCSSSTEGPPTVEVVGLSSSFLRMSISTGCWVCVVRKPGCSRIFVSYSSLLFGVQHVNRATRSVSKMFLFFDVVAAEGFGGGRDIELFRSIFFGGGVGGLSRICDGAMGLAKPELFFVETCGNFLGNFGESDRFVKGFREEFRAGSESGSRDSPFPL